MSGYSTGRAVEYAVRDDLTSHGYDVIRASSSKSPVGDLAAFKPGQILFVNVKRTTMPGPAEREQLWRIAGYYMSALPIVALGPASRIQYRVLTGTGPTDWQPWTPDGAA